MFWALTKPETLRNTQNQLKALRTHHQQHPITTNISIPRTASPPDGQNDLRQSALLVLLEREQSVDPYCRETWARNPCRRGRYRGRPNSNLSPRDLVRCILGYERTPIAYRSNNRYRRRLVSLLPNVLRLKCHQGCPA